MYIRVPTTEKNQPRQQKWTVLHPGNRGSFKCVRDDGLTRWWNQRRLTVDDDALSNGVLPDQALPNDNHPDPSKTPSSGTTPDQANSPPLSEDANMPRRSNRHTKLPLRFRGDDVVMT